MDRLEAMTVLLSAVDTAGFANTDLDQQLKQHGVENARLPS